jgi:hypothetical protein
MERGWAALSDLLVAYRIKFQNQSLLHPIHIICDHIDPMSRGFARYAGVVSIEVNEQSYSNIPFPDIDPSALFEQAIAAILAFVEGLYIGPCERSGSLFWEWHTKPPSDK